MYCCNFFGIAGTFLTSTLVFHVLFIACLCTLIGCFPLLMRLSLKQVNKFSYLPYLFIW